jgi:DNA polymerase-1
MVEYAVRDAEVLIALHRKLTTKIEEAGLSRALEIEQRAQHAVLWMAWSGLPFDEARWLELAEEAGMEAAGLNERLQEMASPPPDGKRWNWNSPQQVKRALSTLGFPVEHTREETLARLDHPFVRLLREYKKKNGISTRHGEKWLLAKDGAKRVIDGRLYPSWKQIGAATGRMACADPNLQAIPHGLGHHSCIRAPEGRVLVKADYSQIELRLAAKMWGEHVMLEAFRDGGDVHEATARSITGKQEITKDERKLAKAVNFGLIFGQGAKGLRDYARNNYGVEMTLEEAVAYRTRFFETYRGIARWHASDDARRRRGQVDTRTLSGRLRRNVRSYTEHLNAPVQGTAADGMKMALALLWERRDERRGAVPILAVHDEIVVECDEGEAEKVEAWLKNAMVDGMDTVVNATEPNVPIEVETSVAQTWGD